MGKKKKGKKKPFCLALYQRNLKNKITIILKRPQKQQTLLKGHATKWKSYQAKEDFAALGVFSAPSPFEKIES